MPNRDLLLGALRPFAKAGELLEKLALRDDAQGGIADVKIGDYRQASRVFHSQHPTAAEMTAALKPFACAGRSIPAKARQWKFGIGLKYGDFLRATEFLDRSAE